jgi:hypothetical protein
MTDDEILIQRYFLGQLSAEQAVLDRCASDETFRERFNEYKTLFEARDRLVVEQPQLFSSIADAVMNAGFPALFLPPVDFNSMYQQSIKQNKVVDEVVN